MYIKESSRLQYINGFLIIGTIKEELKIYLKDISLLMIESSRTAITMPLLIGLVKNHINVIFCDEKHQPIGTINGFLSHSSALTNIKNQISWNENSKKYLWKKIIKLKILMQLKNLENLKDIKDELMNNYMNQVELNDATNREGLAAKIYFKHLFGSLFRRHDDDEINRYLNYGYTILLSMFNRSIVSYGYLTNLGIHHKSNENLYNLSSDFMEPFRPLIDRLVFQNIENKDMLKILRKVGMYKIKFNNKYFELEDAVNNYVKQLLNFLDGNKNKLEIIKMEFSYAKDINYV